MLPLYVCDANGYDKENNVREKEDFINPMNMYLQVEQSDFVKKLGT